MESEDFFQLIAVMDVMYEKEGIIQKPVILRMTDLTESVENILKYLVGETAV